MILSENPIDPESQYLPVVVCALPALAAIILLVHGVYWLGSLLAEILARMKELVAKCGQAKMASTPGKAFAT